jgi:hypothetical protein
MATHIAAVAAVILAGGTSLTGDTVQTQVVSPAGVTQIYRSSLAPLPVKTSPVPLGEQGTDTRSDSRDSISPTRSDDL